VFQIPEENIIWYATMNEWEWYLWTQWLDLALENRFSQVVYTWYDTVIEKNIANTYFGQFADKALKIAQRLREWYENHDIDKIFSTRDLKFWWKFFQRKWILDLAWFEFSFQRCILEKIQKCRSDWIKDLSTENAVKFAFSEWIK
jgi:hypothetical protein